MVIKRYLSSTKQVTDDGKAEVATRLWLTMADSKKIIWNGWNWKINILFSCQCRVILPLLEAYSLLLRNALLLSGSNSLHVEQLTTLQVSSGASHSDGGAEGC